MSYPATALRRDRYAGSFAAGLASSLLYVLFPIAFLVPVQIIYARRGAGGGITASVVAAAGVAGIALLIRRVASSALGGADDLRALMAIAFSPVLLTGALALLIALALLNAPIAADWAPSYRLLAGAGLCVVAVLVFVSTIGSDGSFGSAMERIIEDYLLKPYRAAVASAGADASSLAFSLDAKEIAASFIETVKASFAALLFAMVAGGWRIGNRLSGGDSPGKSRTVPIDDLSLPYPLLWAFLFSWSLVLLTSVLRVPAVVSAIAWNCALTLSLAYAAQGFGIFTYLFKKWNMPRVLRILIAITAVVSMAGTMIGLVVAVALPLFGVTEIWIHYRKPKGAGA